MWVLIRCVFETFALILTCFVRLTLAEYHEQEEIFKLRLGHLKKVKQNNQPSYQWI